MTTTLLESAEGGSISTKVLDPVMTELATHGSAVGLATDCATGPGTFRELFGYMKDSTISYI